MSVFAALPPITESELTDTDTETKKPKKSRTKSTSARPKTEPKNKAKAKREVKEGEPQAHFFWLSVALAVQDFSAGCERRYLIVSVDRPKPKLQEAESAQLLPWNQAGI